ncbi:MAG: glutathione S-transferase C-terminal domain-containing protein [Proteobacteria bacterium]|jgi:GST-like protein|nr:glutathione S-transferase C-terminal domain-containing protein [Pseudomonadota bacterium]MDA1301265.1 glutathione S-transferase C-terminal domain-containing protein [Pseudomonadota bacterium]
MSLEVYTGATPNGWKITIMIEELIEAGVTLPEVNLHTVSLRGDQFTQEYMAINPNQKLPTIVHDGRPIMESCAILQYLGETFESDLYPTDGRRWDVIPWLYWQAANIGPVFGNKLSYTRYITDATDEQKAHPLERFGKEALRLVAVLDRQLAKHPYICGDDFTVADIATWCWVRSYKWAKVDITTKPRVVDWVHRVRARPGVERGISFGVPKDEIDKFSQERRAQYRQNGGSIASNSALRSD